MEWKVQTEWLFTITDMVGDHIAIAVSSEPIEVVTIPFTVWNWKTGIRLVSASPYRVSGLLIIVLR
jgi:hypothetical protein